MLGPVLKRAKKLGHFIVDREAKFTYLCLELPWTGSGFRWVGQTPLPKFLTGNSRYGNRCRSNLSGGLAIQPYPTAFCTGGLVRWPKAARSYCLSAIEIVPAWFPRPEYSRTPNRTQSTTSVADVYWHITWDALEKSLQWQIRAFSGAPDAKALHLKVWERGQCPKEEYPCAAGSQCPRLVQQAKLETGPQADFSFVIKNTTTLGEKVMLITIFVLISLNMFVFIFYADLIWLGKPISSRTARQTQE